MAQSLQVCLLHNAPVLAQDHPDAASESGVLESVAAIGEALRAVGYQTVELAVGESVAVLARQLDELRPDVVINLCESFAGIAAGESSVAGLLELLQLPYTGSPPECLAVTRNKALVKRLLAGAGTPTAEFAEVLRGQPLPETSLRGWLKDGPLFVKPAREDASLGIGQESVVSDWPASVRQVEAIHHRYGDVLVERYIAGREFNVGILELPELQVLPLAEIEFRKLSAAVWPIVTYNAKWNSGSEADRSTPVRCPADVEPELAKQIIAVATDAYRLTGCRDYARVDLRLDGQGNIFVLEVNANPDLGPHAGLARMLRAADISYASFTKRLVETALRRQKAEGRKQKAEDQQVGKPVLAAIHWLEIGDREALLEMTRSCDVFRDDEIEVAEELIREAEKGGTAGHYQVLVAENSGRIIGWACYGKVPMTDGAFDLYWIVVAPESQHRGVGRQLLEEVERNVRAATGRWLLAETSSTAAYEPTRSFYRRCGYRVLGEIGDFYRTADGKITFGKRFDHDS